MCDELKVFLSFFSVKVCFTLSQVLPYELSEPEVSALAVNNNSRLDLSLRMGDLHTATSLSNGLLSQMNEQSRVAADSGNGTKETVQYFTKVWFSIQELKRIKNK